MVGMCACGCNAHVHAFIYVHVYACVCECVIILTRQCVKCLGPYTGTKMVAVLIPAVMQIEHKC